MASRARPRASHTGDELSSRSGVDAHPVGRVTAYSMAKKVRLSSMAKDSSTRILAPSS